MATWYDIREEIIDVLALSTVERSNRISNNLLKWANRGIKEIHQRIDMKSKLARDGSSISFTDTDLHKAMPTDFFKVAHRFTRARRVVSTTGTGIAFVDSDPDTITDSNSDFGDFTAGNTITVSGTTNNDDTYTIATVAAGQLTLISTDTLTAEGAGTSFTVKENGHDSYIPLIGLDRLYALDPDHNETTTGDPSAISIEQNRIYTYPMFTGDLLLENYFISPTDMIATTGTGIAFVDSGPDTITDSNGKFAVFSADETIRVSGSTSNDGTYTVATAVAGTITLIGTDTLTTEAAGDDVTVEVEAGPDVPDDEVMLDALIANVCKRCFRLVRDFQMMREMGIEWEDKIVLYQTMIEKSNSEYRHEAKDY